jgi:cob(I)alamin adenosyltransferase
MKIYTKSGDKGETSLLGGDRVKKYDLRIDAYGTADELNSWIGLLKDQSIDPHYKEFLLEVQDRIFTIGSNLAAIGNKKTNFILPQILDHDILFVEKNIDFFTRKSS